MRRARREGGEANESAPVKVELLRMVAGGAPQRKRWEPDRLRAIYGWEQRFFKGTDVSCRNSPEGRGS